MKTTLEILKEEIKSVEAKIKTQEAEKNSVESFNRSLERDREKQVSKLQSEMDSKMKPLKNNVGDYVEGLRSGLEMQKVKVVTLIGTVILFSCIIVFTSAILLCLSPIFYAFMIAGYMKVKSDLDTLNEYDKLLIEFKEFKSLPIEGLKTFNSTKLDLLRKKLSKLDNASVNARAHEIKSGSDFLISDMLIGNIEQIAKDASEDYKASFNNAMAIQKKKEERESNIRTERLLAEANRNIEKKHLDRIQSIRRQIEDEKRYGGYTLVHIFETQLLKAEEDYREFRRSTSFI